MCTAINKHTLIHFHLEAMLPIRIYLGVGQSMGLVVSIMTHLYQCSILYNSVAALKVLSAMYTLAPPEPLKATDLTLISVCAFPRI